MSGSNSKSLEVPVAGGRRPRVGPGLAVGIDEAMIRDLVHAFYAKVRAEPVLGPIFNAKIKDWDAHLSKLCDFWSSVMLMTGRYKGAPMAVHSNNPEVQPQHFARWLELFGETAREVCPAPAAELFEARACTIGKSLQMGMALARGDDPFQA